MNSELQGLFDLRRDAEESAKRALEAASATLIKEQEEQERLVRRWRAAASTLDCETKRFAAGPSPSTAAQWRARESYLARLREDVANQKSAAQDHRRSALAYAQAAYDEALAAYERAAREREAVSQLAQRRRAAKAQVTARKDEEVATDSAARRPGRGEHRGQGGR